MFVPRIKISVKIYYIQMKYLILSLTVLIAGCTSPGEQEQMEPSVPQDPTGVDPLLIGEIGPDLPVMDKNGDEQQLFKTFVSAHRSSSFDLRDMDYESPVQGSASRQNRL